MLSDLRHAWRALRRAPGYVAAVVLTLAVGIGATTALFGIVDRVLLRPLPYREPARLVRVWDGAIMADGVYDRIRARHDLYADVAGVGFANEVSALVGTEPVRLARSEVTANLFATLGVPAALGRTLHPGDGRSDAAPVAVLADRFWRDRLGGDPGAVGRTLVLDGVRHQIVGVMPPPVRLPSADVAVWTPARVDPADRAGYWWQWRFAVLARLAPGVTPAQATGATRALVRRVGAEDFPQRMGADFGADLAVRPLQDALVGGVRRTLWLLLGAVGVVLLVAVVNATGLALVRAAGRARELVVRAAVGAGRARLVAQLVAEGIVIAGLAAVVGGALAWAFTAGIVTRLPTDLPRAEEIGLDGRAYLVTCLVALAAGVLAALVPALGASRVELRGALAGSAGSGGARGATAGRGGRRLLDRLVVAQLALGVVLAAGAGLLATSLARLAAVDPGFQPARVTVAEVPPPVLARTVAANVPPPNVAAARRSPAPHDSAARRRARAAAEAADRAEAARVQGFYAALVARVRALPGVEQVALASAAPFVNYGGGGVFDSETHPHVEGGPWKQVRGTTISPGALRTLGIPLVAGRDFSEGDTEDAPGVAIVDVETVRRYWPEFAARPARVIGERVRKPNQGAPWLTVVGVAGSVRRDSLSAAAEPSLYLPVAQEGATALRLVVRGRASADALAPALRRTVATLDATVPVGSVRALADHVADSQARPRFVTATLTAFAVVAMLLGAVGVYGVSAFAVARRTREVGVRLALGATPATVRRMILGDGARLAGLGLAVGLALSVAGAAAVRNFLFGVSPLEVVVLVPVAALLGAVVLVATWLPARRAGATDPAVVLRAE